MLRAWGGGLTFIFCITMEEILSRYTETFVAVYAALILGTWLAMILAVLLDLWTGVEKARALGEDVDSHNLRRTVKKIGDYWRVQVFGLMVDVFSSLWLNFPAASLLCGLGVLLIEARSVVENLRQKRSAAAELPDILTRIVKARSRRDAAGILELLKAQPGEEGKEDGEEARDGGGE